MKLMKGFIFIVLLFCFLTGCKPNQGENKTMNQVEWKTALQSRLSEFGHRNWILIVDKAFPSQNGSGITYINSNEKLLAVLSYTLKEIKNSGHVKPIIYQDKELSFITETQSQGVKEYAQTLKNVLGEYQAQHILHDSIFLKIDEAAKLFNVLIIKTNETIPYSSVFVQLDCAYWNAENEKILRSSMEQQ